MAKDLLRYDKMIESAMRGVVRTVLTQAAKSGLPGEHHFYVSFDTAASGVVLSKRLKDKYPSEMTVVLQHRFWDLSVDDGGFEVKLTFDGIPERLSVPFAAVKVFFDPSVPYGLQFEESEATDASAREGAALRPGEGAEAEAANKGPVRSALRTAEKKPRTVRKPRLEKPADDQGEASEPKAPAKPSAANAETGPASSEPKVVSLDKFRKK